MFKKEGETFSFYGRGPKSQSERSTQTQPGAWPACGTQSSFSHEGKWMRTATVPHSPREATFDLLCHSQKLSLVLVTGTDFMTCFRGRRVGGNSTNIYRPTYNPKPYSKYHVTHAASRSQTALEEFTMPRCKHNNSYKLG